MMVPAVEAAGPQPVAMLEAQRREQLLGLVQAQAPQVVPQLVVRRPVLPQVMAVQPLVDLLALPVVQP